MGIPTGDGPNVDENGRPCRSCTDFKSWVKHFGKSATKTGSTAAGATASASDSEKKGKSVQLPEDSENEDLPRRTDCPADKDELGRSTWTFLHTMAAAYPENPSEKQKVDMGNFVHLFSQFYPCWYCAKDLQIELKTHEPDTTSRDRFSQWMCRIHNSVNQKLGKPLFDCTKVDQRWRTGWDDGSCD